NARLQSAISSSDSKPYRSSLTGTRPATIAGADQFGDAHPAAEFDSLRTFVKRVMQRMLEPIVGNADHLELRGSQTVPLGCFIDHSRVCHVVLLLRCR